MLWVNLFSNKENYQVNDKRVDFSPKENHSVKDQLDIFLEVKYTKCPSWAVFPLNSRLEDAGMERVEMWVSHATYNTGVLGKGFSPRYEKNKPDVVLQFFRKQIQSYSHL